MIARMPVGEVDESAVPVDVVDRMQQRALPGGKERNGEEDPR
jgi:hypothetical protein